MSKVKFDHVSSNGTVFKCSKLDLSSPIWYSNKPKDEHMLLQDVTELISFHCFHVWDELLDFPGYDSIQFEEVKNDNLKLTKGAKR